MAEGGQTGHTHIAITPPPVVPFRGWPLSRPHEIPWLFLDFSSSLDRQRLSIYCIALEQSLFHVNYNKHSNQLTKSYKSVHILLNWFNCIIDSCHWYVNCTLKQISVSLTFPWLFFPFSLTTLEFLTYPGFSGFPGEWPPCI